MTEPASPVEPVESRGYALLRTSLTFAFSTFFIGIGVWASYWAEYRNDQYQLLTLGACVEAGGRLYVDCWENKPPAIAWVNALGVALSDDGQFVAWILPGVAGMLALVVFWFCLRRVTTIQAARRSIVLASLLMSMRAFDAPSINPDFYSFSFELMAVSIWMASFSARTRFGLIAAGLLAGLAWAAATAFKQVGCVGLLALMAIAAIMVLTRRPTRGAWFKTVGAATLGFLLGLAVIALVLTRTTPLQEAWTAIVQFNARFVPERMADAPRYAWPRVWGELAGLQLWLWLGLLGMICAAISGPPRTPRAWAGAMVLWILVAGWFAAVGPSMAQRYWQGIWTPVLWLAAAGLEWMNIAYRRSDRQVRIVLGVVFTSVLILLFRPFAFDWRSNFSRAYLSYLEEPNERQRLAEIGRQIAALVPSGERIYIWSYDVGPYIYSGRHHASRFTYPRSPQQMREILDDLAAGKARLILVPTGRPFMFQQWCDAECTARLQQVLEGYEPRGQIGHFTAWLRRDSGE